MHPPGQRNQKFYPPRHDRRRVGRPAAIICHLPRQCTSFHFSPLRCYASSVDRRMDSEARRGRSIHKLALKQGLPSMKGVRRHRLSGSQRSGKAAATQIDLRKAASQTKRPAGGAEPPAGRVFSSVASRDPSPNNGRPNSNRTCRWNHVHVVAVRNNDGRVVRPRAVEYRSCRLGNNNNRPIDSPDRRDDVHPWADARDVHAADGRLGAVRRNANQGQGRQNDHGQGKSSH